MPLPPKFLNQIRFEQFQVASLRQLAKNKKSEKDHALSHDDLNYDTICAIDLRARVAWSVSLVTDQLLDTLECTYSISRY